MINTAHIQREIAMLVCGNKIGFGQFREVHENALIPDTVIKLENNFASFHNVAEWQVWSVVKDTQLAKWFAPCLWISGNGSVLIMKKTVPTDKYPDKVPSFFADIKRDNWGRLDGRVVCHDYAIHNIIEHGARKNMKKATW